MRNTLCPQCNYNCAAHIPLAIIAEPKPGDFAVCSNCGNLNLFDKDMNIIEAPSKDIEQYKIDAPDFYAQIMWAIEMIRERGRMY